MYESCTSGAADDGPVALSDAEEQQIDRAEEFRARVRGGFHRRLQIARGDARETWHQRDVVFTSDPYDGRESARGRSERRARDQRCDDAGSPGARERRLQRRRDTPAAPPRSGCDARQTASSVP